MIEKNVRTKIEELINRAPPLAPSRSGLPRDSQHINQCEGWITEALNIIEVAVPQADNAYRRRVTGIGEKSGSLPQRVGSIAEILRALLADIDAGLLRTLANRITAETFENFLEHAERYHADGRHREAGVIAGVVFEDTIRQICRDNGIIGKDLEALINALTSRKLITGQHSKQAKVAAHVRTKATHALWDEYDLQGVADTIRTTKFFLEQHLGG
jgi:hypothetical protein